MASDRGVVLESVMTASLGQPIGQLRAVPVQLGAGQPRAMLVAYSSDFDVDPYVEMFFFPTDTLKLALITADGQVVWRRDLGKAVIPGVWFCPVLAFDLDGDGVDEIWFVNNTNVQHPLGVSGYVLERLDARTGQTTGQWPWPAADYSQSLSSTFRNFIVGGHVHGDPVLVTAQGTYGCMNFQAYRPDMSTRWTFSVDRDAPGARGSHMCSIADLDGDGVQELMWGERCIRLDSGAEVFCADRDSYRGHSDIVQPVLDYKAGNWLLYTCRESDNDVSPRVATFDAAGNRLWGDVDTGHMDMGWVARLGDHGEPVGMAIRIGHKTCGPKGRFHEGMDEFTYDVLTGEPFAVDFSVYRTLPVDINGDGLHELVRGMPGGDGEVLDRRGNVMGTVGACAAMASKFLDLPGEQVLTYEKDGTVRAWADRNAEDTDAAQRRYANPFYATNQRLTANGYNLVNLGGI